MDHTFISHLVLLLLQITVTCSYYRLLRFLYFVYEYVCVHTHTHVCHSRHGRSVDNLKELSPFLAGVFGNLSQIIRLSWFLRQGFSVQPLSYMPESASQSAGILVNMLLLPPSLMFYVDFVGGFPPDYKFSQKTVFCFVLWV